MSTQEFNYKFYPTLLDAFQYYLNSESDDALQKLLDRINRVPFESEAAEKGKVFNELIDTVNNNGVVLRDEYGMLCLGNYSFRPELVKEICERVKYSVQQPYTMATLKTSKGDVLLYGYADYVKQDRTIDLKTTGQYILPKYTKNWQHKVYPYCFNQSGIQINTFEYLITDFNSVFVEEYPYKHKRDTEELTSFCEQFIDFLEAKRNEITDKKVFGLD